MSFYGIIERFQQNGFADFGLRFVFAFAKFAFWAKRIHGAESVLVVDMFVRHTKM